MLNRPRDLAYFWAILLQILNMILLSLGIFVMLSSHDHDLKEFVGTLLAILSLILEIGVAIIVIVALNPQIEE